MNVIKNMFCGELYPTMRRIAVQSTETLYNKGLQQ